MADNLASGDIGIPKSQRAIHLQPYLNRTIPYWGHPGYFAGQQWRATVKNQPIAIICRDTLISNMLSAQWSVRMREAEPTLLTASKDEIDHYTEVFSTADGDFDTHVSLIMQDMLDLPFGGISEGGRDLDDKDGKLMWMEHIDGATCVPTGDENWPVVQSVPEVPSKPVVFPKHAVHRSYLTPSPSIRRKGWGMAPPEKIYLAITMLFRGDRYYANLLLDTPEAGVLDLVDMSQEVAEKWLQGFKSLFSGIDGFKVPILYEHDTPAQWIPFNRPPTDMLYDSTTLKYAQIVAAGYGLRLSDIGMAELSGDKTLAGVIRGERQSRRTGQAVVRSKLNNYYDAHLPKHLQFVWEEKDEEVKTATARALSTYGLALGQMKRDGLMTPEETRLELVATGLLETEIDPKIIPEPEMPMMGPGGFGQGRDKRKPFGKPNDKERGKIKGDDRGKVPPSQGGRGEVTMRAAPEGDIKLPGAGSFDQLIVRMTNLVKPQMDSIPELAILTGASYAAQGSVESPTPRAPRLRRLIKVVTRGMLPQVEKAFKALDDDAITRFWLPEMQAIDFDMPSELDGLVTRQSVEELREQLDSHFEADVWWKVASAWEKAEILEIYKLAYEGGLHDKALGIIRALYEEGKIGTSLISPAVSFELTNKALLRALERSAADLVVNVNAGTKFFIKRIVIAGVRQSFTAPVIAGAIRDGIAAEELLRREGFVESAIRNILSGMREMSESRTLSIVKTELNRTANEGQLEQIKRSGLKTKAWQHLGKRGETAKGNVHPCPICLGNEQLGFVDADFLFKTVFKSGGPEDDGRAEAPPGHPSECHCSVIFDEKELFQIVKTGEYMPYLGGR